MAVSKSRTICYRLHFPSNILVVDQKKNRSRQDREHLPPLFQSKTDVDEESSISSSTRKFHLPRLLNVNRVLFLVYFAVGKWLLHTGSTSVATLWLGFVLAISGMEAWLKFRAPFCPKPFALDIGRTIFPALNSVELGLCASLWVDKKIQPSSIMGVVATAILLVDIMLLTPRLVKRGKQVVYRHVQKKGGAKLGKDSPEFAALEDEFKGLPLRKTDSWHFVYVGLEGVKIAALSHFI